jgi:prevent-host-death family protein
MVLTSSELRKNLFTVLERALKGEPVEITHKGSTFKILLVEATSSKLDRARKRDILNVPPESIVNSDDELIAELEREWAREAHDLQRK